MICRNGAVGQYKGEIEMIQRHDTGTCIEYCTLQLFVQGTYQTDGTDSTFEILKIEQQSDPDCNDLCPMLEGTQHYEAIQEACRERLDQRYKTKPEPHPGFKRGE